jgi:hypothetical protein
LQAEFRELAILFSTMQGQEFLPSRRSAIMYQLGILESIEQLFPDNQTCFYTDGGFSSF